MNFKDIRGYFSRTDLISVCMRENLCYENYSTIDDAPAVFDEKYLCGIGIVESEFDCTLKSCIEIMLSDCTD